MLFKKTALLGSALVVLSLPVVAQAGLYTQNDTDQDSAVVVTSGLNSGKCTGTLPGMLQQYTKRHDKSDVDWSMVNLLCAGSGSTCTADIHMTKDCSDSTYAKVGLDLKKQSVEVRWQPAQSKYNITSQGSRVYLSNA